MSYVQEGRCFAGHADGSIRFDTVIMVKGTSKRNVQSHSAGNIGYDNVEAYGGCVTDDTHPVTERSNTIGMLTPMINYNSVENVR